MSGLNHAGRGESRVLPVSSLAVGEIPGRRRRFGALPAKTLAVRRAIIPSTGGPMYRDAYMTEVIVTIKAECVNKLDEVLKALSHHGMSILVTRESVVEGV